VFVKRILTATAACHQQGRPLLTFLTEALQAHRLGLPGPSLISPPEYASVGCALVASALLLSSAACAVGQPPLPTPSGAAPVRVAGALLVPANPSLRASCARAAALGGFAVPCPRLIIEHQRPVGCPDQDRPFAGGKDCLEDSAAGRPGAPTHLDSFTYLQDDIVLPGAQHL
jgi:hypothetical protein